MRVCVGGMLALNVTCELNNVLLEYFLKAKESILQKNSWYCLIPSKILQIILILYEKKKPLQKQKQVASEWLLKFSFRKIVESRRIHPNSCHSDFCAHVTAHVTLFACAPYF